MLTVFGALAELERDQILQRQAEGIAIAEAAGKYKGRKPMESTVKNSMRWLLNIKMARSPPFV